MTTKSNIKIHSADYRHPETCPLLTGSRLISPKTLYFHVSRRSLSFRFGWIVHKAERQSTSLSVSHTHTHTHTHTDHEKGDWWYQLTCCIADWPNDTRFWSINNALIFRREIGRRLRVSRRKKKRGMFCDRAAWRYGQWIRKMSWMISAGKSLEYIRRKKEMEWQIIEVGWVWWDAT